SHAAQHCAASRCPEQHPSSRGRSPVRLHPSCRRRSCCLPRLTWKLSRNHSWVTMYLFFPPLRKIMGGYSHVQQIPRSQTSRRCGTDSRSCHASDRRSPLGEERENFGRARGVIGRPRHSAYAARGVLGEHATGLIRLPTGIIHESPSHPSRKNRFSSSPPNSS